MIAGDSVISVWQTIHDIPELAKKMDWPWVRMKGWKWVSVLKWGAKD